MRAVLAKLLASKPVWLVVRQLRKIWVRVLAFAALALATLLLARIFGDVVPPEQASRLGADAVDRVLSILATSMLAVTTFSLSIAVSAYSSAAQTATPRATALLQEDPTTQNVLATFLGAFLFSLLGVVGLSAGFYTQSGRLLLFIATGLVIAAVVIALLRWISHLTDFGRMEDTLARVEAATADSLGRRMERPLLGGAPERAPPPEDAQPVLAETTGYVQHIDMEQVCEVAREFGARIWLRAVPGCFVHPAAPLFLVAGAEVDDDKTERLRAAVTCGETRSFDQDPRFGLIVLSEIASRALSPGVNDQGTAIDVIGRLVRVLSEWRSDEAGTPDFPEVMVPPIAVEDLLVDAFRPIARDGAGVIEVQIRLQKALRALADISPATFAKAAGAASEEAIGRAETAGLLQSEMESLRSLALARQ